MKLETGTANRFLRGKRLKLFHGPTIGAWTMGEEQVAYDAIYEAGGVFIFQPAYSPENNPIEEAFSQLKRHLRSVSARLSLGLCQAISSGFELIQPSHMRAYWQHTQDNVLSW